ncbi:MAG: iron-containing alcohol dehydrogenase [Pseudomonadota bacterium]
MGAEISFAVSRVPDMLFGNASLDQIGRRLSQTHPSSRAFLIADRAMVNNGVVDRVSALLEGQISVFSGFSGEPTINHVRDSISKARRSGADIVIGLGGGSALDLAKITAVCATSPAGPDHYAMGAHPLPDDTLPIIAIPTAAGTGSEANGSAIYADAKGRKVWIFGQKTKPELAILDPELTVSLPPHLTAWCGLDAFIHAFESATNRYTNSVTQHYSLKALQLVAGSLERAVTTPDDLSARADLLLGAFYAGYAIDNTGTAIAHNLSHALAMFGHVHHGLATALSFELTLPWVIELPDPSLDLAATACGLKSATDLPAFFTDLMDRLKIERRLPKQFAGLTSDTLAEEMAEAEHKPMLLATTRLADEDDIAFIAKRIVDQLVPSATVTDP